MIGYTYISSVTDDLIFEFFPAFHTSFDEDLRTQTETLRREITKFVGIVGKTRTETTKSKRRPENDRVTDFFSCSKRIID